MEIPSCAFPCKKRKVFNGVFMPIKKEFLYDSLSLRGKIFLKSKTIFCISSIIITLIYRKAVTFGDIRECALPHLKALCSGRIY